jgi:drug/metabolite transporter (DMT)-like permease
MIDPRKSLLTGPLSFWRSAPPVIRGILMMCIASVFFSSMHVVVRHISRDLPPMQIAFLRNIFGVLVFLPLLSARGFAFLRTRRIGLYAVRGLVDAAAMLMFFTGLALVPVARVTALTFSAPLFAAVLSVVFLGERFRLRRWVAIGLGFAGTLIILRPGAIPLDLGSVLVVGTALCWGVSMILIKMLSSTESSFVIAAYMNLFLSLFTFFPGIWVWLTPSPGMWFWLVMIGILGTIAQISLSQALKETEPTAVLPFDFLKLVWAALLGLWVFGELPDFYTWVGAFVVFGSSFYIAWREHQHRRTD